MDGFMSAIKVLIMPKLCVAMPTGDALWWTYSEGNKCTIFAEDIGL